MDTPPPAGGGVLLPNWVLMSGASPASITLYCALKGLADEDGMVRVYPTKLARLIGLSRGDKLVPYTRELAALGAVSVLRAARRLEGEYLVRDTPPEGYTGPRTREQWLEQLDRPKTDGEAAA